MKNLEKNQEKKYLYLTKTDTGRQINLNLFLLFILLF